MSLYSETILTTQTHPGDSTVESVTGSNFKGDGYYGRSDGFHTVQYAVTGFIGDIVIQATLAIEPTEEDWFPVLNYSFVVPTDLSGVDNFIGNYVWIRAKIETWTDGSVNSVILNH